MGPVLKDKNAFNKILIERGFSKKSFANVSGLGTATIINITNGRRNPSPETAKKIIDALGVCFDDVFEIKEGRNNE